MLSVLSEEFLELKGRPDATVQTEFDLSSFTCVALSKVYIHALYTIHCLSVSFITSL